MKKVVVEFFHDTICSFCFPMSYRMRQLQEMMPELEIAHRSFALIKSADEFALSFASREASKEEILKHWEHANQNDDLHRFNIIGMRQTDFLFPTSMNALLACKAAFFAAGSEGYWDVFDALQDALFVRSRNIEAQDVIDDCVKQTTVEFSQWEQHYNSDHTKEAVEKDLLLVEQYGIHSVPCLIINGKHRVEGALSLPQIVDAIRSACEIKEESEPVLL